MVSRRPAAPPRALSITIHVIGLLFFANSIHQIPNGTNPLRKGFGGPYKFLTIIGLMMSTTTFVIGLLSDVFDARPLYKAKNYLSLCTTPIELLITIAYWSLYAIDRTMLTPPGHQLPLSQDLSLHAIPTIMLVADLLVLSPPWPVNGRSALALDLGLTFTYWGWIEYCFSINGWYPYPALKLLPPFKKLLLCIVWASFLAATTMLLKGFHQRRTATTYTKRATDFLKTR